MFAGGTRRSSNVRVMQLFHELKQQFPTVPDYIVSSCIASYTQSTASDREALLRENLQAVAAQELMGRSPAPHQTPTPGANPPQVILSPCSEPKANLRQAQRQRDRSDMSVSESDADRNPVKSSASYSRKNESVRVNADRDGHRVDNSTFYAKRPDTLGIKPDLYNGFDDNDRARKLQLSEKCRDVHKLLNQVVDKPPRSPLTAKRPLQTKNELSPDANRRLQNLDESGARKKETVSTPTQTTDTLINGVTTPGSVNLSLNVNCSMDVVQSPTKPKCTTVLQLTPQQPWLQEPVSPRSYTSVNLTLRPPSSEPQAPIDITSQNSSLTYSTSSFDSQRGLQSRLQITVGPGGGSVASVRARPRSSYHPQNEVYDLLPARAGSLNSLLDNDKPPVINQQEVRIERLRIELKTDKTKLVVMQEEFAEMERKRKDRRRINAELKKQLEKEIKHLKYQCLNLTGSDFYNNLYTGQRGAITSDLPELSRMPRQMRMLPLQPDMGWNCSMCTFLNHPDLSKCEQCDMQRTTYHGRHNPAFECRSGAGDRILSEMMQSLNLPEHDQVLERLSLRNDRDILQSSVPLQQSASTPNFNRNNVVHIVNNANSPNLVLTSYSSGDVRVNEDDGSLMGRNQVNDYC